MFYNETQILGFLLVLVRITAFLVVSPLFSMRNIPNLVKISLGIVIALVIFPVIEIGELPIGNLFAFFLFVISEASVGLLIGFTSTMMFNAFRVAGQLIDLQIGYAMSQVFDPAQGTQNTITGHFFHLLAMVLFLGLNGHHSLILALIKSFDLVPLTTGKITGPSIELLLTSFLGMLVMAFQIAAPVLAVLLIIDISLGMVGKTVPQINVFMTGFPIKIGVGLLTLAVILPIIVTVSQHIFNQIEKDILLLMRSIT